MYWLGTETPRLDLLETSLWQGIPELRFELSQTPIDSIIDLLDSFGKTSFEDALPELIKESGFSPDETRKTLGLLPGLLSRESLERRLKAEFIRTEVLDRFTKLPEGKAKVRAIPQGTVLHVTAGNVFLSSIDSLIMGFLTKNISLIKVSGQNKFFPLHFAKKLLEFDRKKILSNKFSILYWKGGEENVENFIKSKVDAIVAWGGEEMISSYQKNLPRNVKLLDFGPKISLQIIGKEGLKNKDLKIVAQKIVDDIIPWDQGACASPQNLYLEEGIDADLLLKELSLAFDKAPNRGRVNDDEATEILKEKYRGLYSELMEEGHLSQGENYLLHLEKNNTLRPSPLGRSLIVKRFKNVQGLASILEPFSYYLQSCSYLLGRNETDQYLEALAMTGIKRFAPLGTITWGMEGAPHDGRFVLRELVKLIGHEERAVNYGEEAFELSESTTLKAQFDSTPHPVGYIFSSGGTTGDPKFLHFSYEEFDYMSDMLAENMRKQGLKKGMTVANLFVAGNLWSSFMCVERALEKIGAIQLPIGGLCSQENVLFYLKKFEPDVVMGIPSLLVLNAEHSEAQKAHLKIPFVFYAGEALSELRQEYLKKVWGTEHFSSAGYASVDAGVIGYQCQHCAPGEHHVFSDMIDLTIVEDEAVVTALARKSMAVENYRTGDKIEWISDCLCGSSDRRFKLLGRIDNVIQIWSCRMLVGDVEESLKNLNIRTFQLRVFESREANLVREKLELCLEHSEDSIEIDALLMDIYERSRDVKDTIKFTEFKKDIILKSFQRGQIPRNPRTGKISVVLDERL